MSLDITIHSKPETAKSVPLSTILGDQLKFGYFDKSWRMVVGELGRGEFTAYDPSLIGRGFIVAWTPGENMQVSLKLLMPSTREELRAYFDCVTRIASFWETDTIEVNHSSVSVKSFENGFDELAEYNDQTILKMANRILNDERKPTTLISAIYPLTVGKEEAKQIVGNIHYFTTWMHRLQSIYGYFASPRYFRDEKGIYARYHFSENIPNIMPKVPQVQYGTRDERTGKPLICDRFEVFLVSTTLKGGIALLCYDDFLAKLPQEKVSRFDDDHILVEPMDFDELKEMAGLNQLIEEAREAADVSTEKTSPENAMSETGVIPIPRDENEA